MITNSLSLRHLIHLLISSEIYFCNLRRLENMEIAIALACDVLNFNSLHTCTYVCCSQLFWQMHHTLCIRIALTCWSDKCFTGKMEYMFKMHGQLKQEWILNESVRVFAIYRNGWRAMRKRPKAPDHLLPQKNFQFQFPNYIHLCTYAHTRGHKLAISRMSITNQLQCLMPEKIDTGWYTVYGNTIDGQNFVHAAKIQNTHVQNDSRSVCH